jgi:ubiquinol-cytochrome c reductase iron-sulfur subunit
MRRPLRWFVAALVLARAVRPHRSERPPRERIIPAEAPSPRAELVVAGLLLGCAAAAVLAVVAYAAQWSTQAFGGALAGALALLAAALIVSAEHLVVTEELEEEYPEPGHPEEQEEVVRVITESGDGITRKRLLFGAAGLAAGAIGAAAIAPALSLGPVFDVSPLARTPWRRGRRLIGEDGLPLRAAEIEEDNFYTAFPAGANRDDIGSPVVVVRVPPGDLRLPPDRRNWSVDGIVAYSKVCTHAGCAVALYRKPTFPPVQPRPALVCPCHYSTFDPGQGGKVLFGPAGRALPQLPLMVDRRGRLRAAGNFSGPVGPSWWGVRSRKARS